jgi:hypothetical protein
VGQALNLLREEVSTCFSAPKYQSKNMWSSDYWKSMVVQKWVVVHLDSYSQLTTFPFKCCCQLDNFLDLSQYIAVTLSWWIPVLIF